MHSEPSINALNQTYPLLFIINWKGWSHIYYLKKLVLDQAEIKHVLAPELRGLKHYLDKRQKKLDEDCLIVFYLTLLYLLSDVFLETGKVVGQNSTRLAGNVIVGVSAAFLVWDAIDLGINIADLVIASSSGNRIIHLG